MQETLKAMKFTGNGKYEVIIVLLRDSLELLRNLHFLVLFQV